MSVEDKAELIMAIKNYKCKKREKRTDGVDFKASDIASEEKILLRAIETQGKTGFIGIDDVKKMLKVMKHGNYNSGVLIGNRFTDAAVQEMKLSHIQQVSDEYMPSFQPEKIYLTINDCVNNLCKAKCGEIPQSELDCKSHHLKEESCRVRSISDNAFFHFEHGWCDLMKDDLKQLLSLNKPQKAQNGPKKQYLGT
jgi:hypothetical protein